MSTDLSEGGFGALDDDPLEPGTVVDVQFCWPESAADVRVQAEIVWRQPTAEAKRRFGARFFRVGPQIRAQIQALVAGLQGDTARLATTERSPWLRGVDDYYSEAEPAVWSKVLGPDLHYHFGDHRGEPTDSVQTGLKRAVRNTYDYLPRRGRILDAGCGWGGAAKMLAQEHDCDVTGVTISVSQANYCRTLGLKVVLEDLETLEPKEEFDGVLLLESLSHIRDKVGLLTRLRRVTRRLVMTVNCVDARELQSYYRGVQRHEGGYVVHDGNLLLTTPAELQGILTQTGWTIRKFDDRRAATLPTIWFWEENLQRTFGDGPVPTSLVTLAKMTRNVRRSPEKFVRTYPLVDVVADAS